MAKIAPLQFLNFEIVKVVFDKPAGFTDGNFKVSGQHLTKVNETDKNLFLTEFIITITTEQSPFNLQVQAYGAFKILGEVDELIYENYINISAPSILYPYLRAFISNFIIQTGMKAIFIPPLNFGSKEMQEQVSNQLKEGEAPKP